MIEVIEWRWAGIFARRRDSVYAFGRIQSACVNDFRGQERPMADDLAAELHARHPQTGSHKLGFPPERRWAVSFY